MNRDFSLLETKTTQDLAREVGVVAERSSQRFEVVERRLDEAKESQDNETQRLDRAATDQQQRLGSTCDRLNTAVSDLRADLDRCSNSAARQAEKLELDMQNKAALLGADLSVLASDSKRAQKKLGDDIETNKKNLAAQLDALKQDTKINL